jgi:hypothetical protein
MHLKLDYNLVFIITLENMKLYYHLLLKNSFYLFPFIQEKKLYKKYK